MRNELTALAQEINSNYLFMKNQANELRKTENLIKKINSLVIDISVCAVDGGILAHRMHGADIVVYRSAGVRFIYENSKLKSCDYFPNRTPKSLTSLKHSLDEHEANLFRSLVRLKSEISCAIELLENFSPEILLLDGSLTTLPSDRPEKESELSVLYSEVMGLYQKLYSYSKEKNCIICGVIKDSRSRTLSSKFGLKCSDSLLCQYLLNENEMTVAFPHDQNPNIYLFYIKPSDEDIPLRVEVLGKENIEKAASIVNSLSSLSKAFAYPAVLVESDMCAALDPNEIESVEQTLCSLCGIRPLRRNSRPFR
ncbi:MAG: DNA double-strand break repair nuclease NurA [Candidatus Micrarchaeota archaeon]|nr:DNA double-strand break repair nuclease NurA [Candidatus Micrarchaeota archaeon]MBU1886572.1 DNA double-strand break repair nuclease NurA [Candidatus Micrarchaeota archaeon]